jgi:hypothetical protein
MNERIKILVVTHKEYDMPKDRMYFPICVGENAEELKSRIQGDDEGENISKKNNQYSELTALFWAWKNLESDYIGLVHYRRHMSMGKAGSLDDILSEHQALELLKDNRVLVVKKRVYPRTIKQHYINSQKKQHEILKRRLEILEETLTDLYPEYQEAFRKVMNGHAAHMFNIFVMKREDLNLYCTWMFSLLFEAEKRIDEAGIKCDRLMGTLSEFLLDTWLSKKNIEPYELNLYQTELNFWNSLKRFIYRRYFET